MPKIKDMLLGSAEIALGCGIFYTGAYIAKKTGYYPAAFLGGVYSSPLLADGTSRITGYRPDWLNFSD